MQELEGFRHVPGAHCGSTALSNIARFYGHALTEPLCFGIAEGMGFMAIALPDLSPSRMIAGRNPFLEAQFFENLGVPFAWEKEAQVARAWDAARTAIDCNLPVLLQADLRYLPYYASKTHFTGHVVVLAGYDEAAGKALLSDTHFDTLQTVSLDDLARARSSAYPPRPLANDYFVVHRFEPPKDLGPLLRGAIARQARTLLERERYGSTPAGVQGMERVAETFPEWAEAPDWKWCARFAYQVIERRGTGGGNFRALYAKFLGEAARWLPDAGLPALAGRMEAIAAGWTELAMHLKAISEADSPAGFDTAGRKVGELAAAERAWCEAALEASA
jgi:hypothetical protein